MTASMRLPGLALTSFLAACVAAPAAEQPIHRPPPPPPTYNILGLENVMGRDAATLVAQFGNPDLDIREADARKLQFSSSICVLDAYLYPPPQGGAPIVTWLDARLPDGRDFDRLSCVAALGRRQQAPQAN
jgi:hypothetical protein